MISSFHPDIICHTSAVVYLPAYCITTPPFWERGKDKGTPLAPRQGRSPAPPFPISSGVFALCYLHANQSPANASQSCHDILAIQTVMSNGPDSSLAHRTHQHAVFAGLFQELHGLGICQSFLLGVAYRKVHDIGDNPLNIDVNLREICQAKGEPLTILVIFGQSLYHLLQGHDAGRGKNASLSHSAS